MGFRLEEFVTWSPYIYHVTRSANLARLRRTRALMSAGELLRLAGRLDLLCERRAADVVLAIEGETVILRDQARLVLRSLELAEDVSVEDCVEYLNQWVFLWPGELDGPRGRAKALLEADRASDAALLRFRTRDLLVTNPDVVLHFCDRNSGAARHHSGKKAQRNLHMHRRAGLFRGSPSGVVEVAVEKAVLVPESAELSDPRSQRWQPIWAAA